MKISHDWLRDYLPHTFPITTIERWLTEIGLEVEGIHTTESIKGGLKGVVTGQVLTCVRHPNADRLSLTTVDIGGQEPSQIVCGASNVAVGQKVLVATPGTMIYPAEGDSFEIKTAKVRGELSAGMICAEDELGLGDSHDGILVLPNDTPVGISASELYKIVQDEIIEIGLTPNRADANSHFGTARDLWAALHIHEGLQIPLNQPLILDKSALPSEGEMNIHLQATDKCQRYMGLEITGVTVAESPEWLKKRLQSIGQKPINNIVDVTNFVMFELGQPLHAFDREAIPGNDILVCNAQIDKDFIGLDGVSRKLVADDLVIATAGEEPMCLAGVYGAEGYGVKSTTQAIFLESACFQSASVRRTSLRHNLRTESAAHFERGVDPGMCPEVLLRAAHLILEVAGGQVSSRLYDVYPQPTPERLISISPERVNRLLGKVIPSDQMLEILQALSMGVVQLSQQEWQVTVPGYKIDVLREADLVEEIVRIYGLNNIEASESFQYALNQARKLDDHTLRNQAMDFLVANGFHEIMGLSIINADEWTKISGFDSKIGVRINNTSNLQLDLLRPEALSTALEVIRYNVSRQQTSLRMFEFGRTYKSHSGEYIETPFLSFFISGDYWKESWQNGATRKSDIYLLKSLCNNLLHQLGIFDLTEILDETEENYVSCVHISAGGKNVAIIGEIKTGLLSRADIKHPVYFAQLRWETVLALLEAQEIKQFEEFSRFPMVRRDLALMMDEGISYTEVASLIRSELGSSLSELNLFDEFRNEELLSKRKKSYAISMMMVNRDKTWAEKDLDVLISKVINKLKVKYGIEIRK